MFKQIAIALCIAAASTGVFYGYTQISPEAESSQAREKSAQPIKVSAVYRTEVEDIIRSVGTVSAADKVAVVTKVSGYISRISVTNRDWVQKGDVLFTIESSDAKSKLDSAMTTLKDAQIKNQRLRSLMAKKLASKAELDDSETALGVAQSNAEVAQQYYRDHTVRAPIEGVVDIDELSEGEYLGAGQSVGNLKNSKTVDIRFTIPQGQAHEAKPGQRLRVSSGSDRGYTTEGQLTSSPPLSRSATTEEDSPKTSFLQGELRLSEAQRFLLH